MKDLPIALKQCRTVLIPKSGDLSQATNWRPITILSILVRVFHNILASRLRVALNLHPAQQAFIAADGAMSNTLLLDFAINSAKKRRRPLSVVSIDLAKAFDSVGHHSLTRALCRLSLEPDTLSYILNTYQSAATTISCGSSTCGPFSMTRGVKQGDPLSPILFNAVLDELLESLPDGIGIPVGVHRVNVLAFADDLFLLAESEFGMRELLDHATRFFSDRGLRVNAAKCHSLVFRKHGKSGKIVTVSVPVFTLCGLAVRPITSTGFFKYLGIYFSHNGKNSPVLDNLQTHLDRLRSSALKPQQKIVLLRIFLLPRYSHTLTLSRLHKGVLRRVDASVRDFCKKVLRLPHYTPNSFFYTAAKDGGLGLPNFISNVPLNVRNRLTALKSNPSPVIRDVLGSDFVAGQLDNCNSIMGSTGATKASLKADFLASFSSSVYGLGLNQGYATASNHWLGNYSRTSDARMHLKKLKFRLNILPCRGMPANHGDRSCRAGCGRVESLSHISQQCSSVLDKRIERHNKVLSFLANSISDTLYTKLREPVFNATCPTSGRQQTFKPDLVLVTPTDIIIIDVGICWETPQPVARSYALKARTYDTDLFKSHVLTLFPNRKFQFYALTISGRGIFAEENNAVCALLKLGLGFKIKAVEIVLEHSVYLYQHFMSRAFAKSN